MVYGRYNELVHGDYFMVYKPTNITGGPILYPLVNVYILPWKITKITMFNG